MKKIIILTGATGTKKTQTSIAIAKKYNCEIINVDATQFYQGLNVGTNKITNQGMDGVVHHLLSFLTVDKDYSIYDFTQTVAKIIDTVINKKKHVLLVGSSGLYIASLVKPYFFTNERDENFANLYQFSSNEELYETLKRIDPVDAKKMHENNRIRVLRALEIFYLTGKTKTQLQKEQNKNIVYQPYIIQLKNSNQEMYHLNLKTRIAEELQNGFIEETKNILIQYPNFLIYNAAKIMGYQDVIDYLNKKINFLQLEEILFTKTKKLIKKQKTFYRTQLSIDLIVDINLKTFINTINREINAFLKN